ncbi:transglutaminase-like cysteine peptidase [Aquibium sp. LZ166]|uniref:Transglutaminase-like cysteine peptidase n=1 Tax=Aquibium pacificus TaxID=3153579 RepID=A0ABV3SLK7_9HYPH
MGLNRLLSSAIASLTGAGAALVLAATGTALAGSIGTGGLTSQPIGHYEFCRANPAECSIAGPDAGPLVLNKAVWTRISKVNVEVNSAIKPMSDKDIFGKDEVWAFPTSGMGDCEDYVLEKRRRLFRGGIPLSDLLITVVRKRDGEGHAVLTVRTDKGDYILDNLSDTVKAWEQTGYRYLKRQASTHTGRWVSLRDDNTLMVGSVRN